MEARSEKLWWRRGGRGFPAFGSNLGGVWVVFGLAFGWCLAFGSKMMMMMTGLG